MKSKTQLFIDIDSLKVPAFGDILTKKLKHSKLGNETFGRTSCIYLHFADHTERTRIERELANRGHKVCESYCPGSAVAEVQVTYFKGWHWAE